MNQSHQNAGTAGTDGVAKSDGTAINIGFFRVNAQFCQNGNRLGCEGLVDFKKVNVCGGLLDF